MSDATMDDYASPATKALTTRLEELLRQLEDRLFKFDDRFHEQEGKFRGIMECIRDDGKLTRKEISQELMTLARELRYEHDEMVDEFLEKQGAVLRKQSRRLRRLERHFGLAF